MQSACKAADAADSAAHNLEQLAAKLEAALEKKRASLGGLETAHGRAVQIVESLQAEVYIAKGRIAATVHELQGKRHRLQHVQITRQLAESEFEEAVAGQGGSHAASGLDAAVLELAAPTQAGNKRFRFSPRPLSA